MKLNSSSLRMILTGSIIIFVVLSTFSFYFIQAKLHTLSRTNKTSSSASLTKASKSEIQTLEKEMLGLQDIVEKTNEIMIDQDNYQNQAIQDINKYATDSGVSLVGGFSFNRPATADGQLNLADTGTATRPVIINIENPVEYSKFLNFIRLIETNIPKMQISGINISRSENSKTTITSDPITIEVYVK